MPHHVAHAASAYYPSGFDSAGVLVADGIGEAATTVLYAGEGGRLTRLEELRYPDSLGFVWEKLSAFLGFSEYDASKVMGLAGYGDPLAPEPAFGKFLDQDGAIFAADPDVLRFRLPDIEPLRRLLGDPRRSGPIESRHADVAAALQEATNRTMLRLAAHLHGLHPTPNLCRQVLNRKVKHREDFRPFAPSVLAEEADAWFELGRPSRAYASMLFTCPVRPDKAARIPAVLHVDGTARAQTVDRTDNPRYHRLISAFADLAGVPMVLNTSFNDSEPIVCSPVDALHTFLGTRIDAVALGDHLVERPDDH